MMSISPESGWRSSAPGASAAQFIPIVAEHAAQVLVLQRTPNWLLPTPEYHDDVSQGQRWLLNHVPHYSQWYRFWLFWRYAEGILPAVTVDPEWDGQGHSVSAANEHAPDVAGDVHRVVFRRSSGPACRGDARLPAGGKADHPRQRHLGDDAEARQRATSSPTPFRASRPTAWQMDDGTTHVVDVIIYATGFHASRFLTPMTVTGRCGIDLHEQWDGNARAYLGVVTPNFPNFFMLYGPNTNIVVNGSIIYFSECEVHYVLQCLRHILTEQARAIDCRSDVHDRYNERIDEGNRLMAWGASSVNSWYKSESGRVAQNWPFSLLEFWQQTREVDDADYEML